MLTLCPAGRTQPVAASGCAASGEAATQIVCDTRLTNVTTRLPAGATTGGLAACPEPLPATVVVEGRPEGRVAFGVAGTCAVTAGRAVSGAAAAGADAAVVAGTGLVTAEPPPLAEQAASSRVTRARPARPSARTDRLVHFVRAIRVLPLLWCSRLGDRRRAVR